MSTKKSDVMDQFFTADRASAGVKLFLEDPNGQPTDQWMQIRGADSEEFRLTEIAGKREAVALHSMADEAARDLRVVELSRRMAATLVIAWSFPQECTQENVVAFFKRAPQIQDKVDRAAATRRLFFKVESDNSTPTPEQSTGST